jgi:hypothetical protein
MTPTQWAEKDLRRDDFTFLSDILRSKYSPASSSQIDRLIQRGFVATGQNASLRVTIKGLVALLVMRLSG